MASMTVTSSDGTTLAARVSGDGPPIVLVHGGNGDLDTFRLIEPLLAERHTVWVYSRRGRGGSGDAPDYSFRREIEDVLAVVAAAGDEVHLLGHSGGAAYALAAAASLPSLRSLILYEPPLRLDGIDLDVLEAVEAAVAAGEPGRALDTAFPSEGITDDEGRLLRSMEPVWARLCEGVRLVPREIRAGLAEGDRLQALRPPGVATLYLRGEHTDAPVFATPAEVEERFPKAEQRVLAGQRHLAFAFAPDAFARAVLDFTTAT